MALLGTRNITSGDTRRYEVNYSQFLTGAGATGKLKNPSVTIAASTPPVTSTVGSVSLSVDDTRLFFYITGGSAINEQFTIDIQIQDTQGETVNDTIGFTVVSP